MANMRDIRLRIRSIKNIEQITKAMKMVAAAKLQRAQERALGSDPFMRKLKEIVGNLSGGASSHPLMEKPTGTHLKKAYLLITADKGLAGAYSSNAIKELLPAVKDQPEAELYIVGRKGRDYFARREYPIQKEYLGFSERPTVEDGKEISDELANLFLSGNYESVHIVYTQFFSPAHHQPRTLQLLPIEPEETKVKKQWTEFEYEPNEKEILEWLIPMYLETLVYGALNQSAASELGSRMTAMSSATDNAKDLISSLTLHYNKVRQAGITREITEIVGGAEALK